MRFKTIQLLFGLATVGFSQQLLEGKRYKLKYQGDTTKCIGTTENAIGEVVNLHSCVDNTVHVNWYRRGGGTTGGTGQFELLKHDADTGLYEHTHLCMQATPDRAGAAQQPKDVIALQPCAVGPSLGINHPQAFILRGYVHLEVRLNRENYPDHVCITDFDDGSGSSNDFLHLEECYSLNPTDNNPVHSSNTAQSFTIEAQDLVTDGQIYDLRVDGDCVLGCTFKRVGNLFYPVDTSDMSAGTTCLKIPDDGTSVSLADCASSQVHVEVTEKGSLVLANDELDSRDSADSTGGSPTQRAECVTNCKAGGAYPADHPCNGKTPGMLGLSCVSDAEGNNHYSDLQAQHLTITPVANNCAKEPDRSGHSTSTPYLNNNALQMHSAQYNMQSSVIIDLQYDQEQVVAEIRKSTAYVYFTGSQNENAYDANTNVWDGANFPGCNFEFNFGTNTQPSSFSSWDQERTSTFTVPTSCFNGDSVDSNTRGEAKLDSYIQLFYCAGSDSTCADVSATALGFSPAINSLREEPDCTRLQYRLKITLKIDEQLNQVVTFILDDEVRSQTRGGDKAITTHDNRVVALENPVEWAICPVSDDGSYDYDGCFDDAAAPAQFRLLTLSDPGSGEFPAVTNTFSLAFKLSVEDSADFQTSKFPLTINSYEMWLFKGDYAGEFNSCVNHPGSCFVIDPSGLGIEAYDSTDSSNYPSGLSLSDNEVLLQGQMPEMVDAYNCDKFLCTMVWVLNFKTNPTPSTRLLLRSAVGKGSDGRLLESDGSQHKVVKISAPQRETNQVASNQQDNTTGERTVPTDAIIGGLSGIIVGGVAFTIYNRKRSQAKGSKLPEDRDDVRLNSA